MAFLDTTVGQIENGLKRLNNWPKEFDEDARLT